MNKKFSHFIFDLDGVIFNSKNNMKISWIKTSKKFNLNISFDKYFGNIGIPFHEILKKLKIKKNYKLIENEYKKNSKRYINKVKLYPGIKKFFLFLKKKHISYSIVTSKDFERSTMLLKKNNLKPKSLHVPSKKYKGKPSPDLINHCLKKNKYSRKSSCYIGDTEHDFNASKNANINFIFAKYGYGKFKKKYKFSIDTPLELFRFL